MFSATPPPMTKVSASLLLIAILLVLSGLAGCKKDEQTIVSGNDAPYHEPVATVLIENYVNRLFIDLIGREPLDVEMAREVKYLKDNDLSTAARNNLVIKLQSDTAWIEGDTSYKKAYFHRFYLQVKSRMIEGASQAYINTAISVTQNGLNTAMILGDSVRAANARAQLGKLKAIISIENNYQNGVIDIGEVFGILLDNSLYDFINMNTFNFVNASFDNLYYRLPTIAEFKVGYDMIEFNIAGTILGQTGEHKGDYIDILTSTREFYEGLIKWTYIAFVARDPSTAEVDAVMSEFFINKDFQTVQQIIMITDEYANF